MQYSSNIGKQIQESGTDYVKWKVQLQKLHIPMTLMQAYADHRKIEIYVISFIEIIYPQCIQEWRTS